MPQSSPAGNKKYYTQFPTDTHPLIHSDSRLQWDALYNLRDKQTNVIQMTLTNNVNLDAPLTANSATLFILNQDTVGGWTPTWAVNPDGSKKFKGTAAVGFITTANTFTSLLFWAISTTTAYLVNGITGGDL